MTLPPPWCRPRDAAELERERAHLEAMRKREREAIAAALEVERGYGFRATAENGLLVIEQDADDGTAEVAPKPGVCRHCGQYLDRRGKCRNPEHNS